MKTPPPSATSGPSASVLFAAPRPDQIAFSKIVRRARWPMCPDTRWKIRNCASVQDALRRLEGLTLPIVMCDCDLGRDAWIELLSRLEDSPAAPFVIVTSRLADDRLWAEALNLGAYDVLAKPFEAAEVIRTLSFAWLHWANRNGLALPPANDPPRGAEASSAAPTAEFAARTRA